MGCLLTPFYQKEVIALSNTKAGLCELSITINGNHAAKVEIKLLYLNETIEMNLNKRGVEILMKRVQANPIFVVCKKTIFTQPIQFDLSKNQVDSFVFALSLAKTVTTMPQEAVCHKRPAPRFN